MGKQREKAAASEEEAGPVIIKALGRAAEKLGIAGQGEVAAILGGSAASISRLLSGGRVLDPSSKEGERALLFLRIFRRLEAIVGGNERAAREWFFAHNHHLGGVPADRVRSITGLVHVADYLDAMISLKPVGFPIAEGFASRPWPSRGRGR